MQHRVFIVIGLDTCNMIPGTRDVTQVVSTVPPGHPCRFPFSFFFLRFSFPFRRSPFPPSFSFCLFVVSFSCFFLYHLRSFFALPCSPWWRILFFCVGATYPPPAQPARLQVWVFPLRAVFFLAFFLLIYFVFLLSLFGFRFGRRLFYPVFFLWVLCCVLGFGFCCDSCSM